MGRAALGAQVLWDVLKVAGEEGGAGEAINRAAPNHILQNLVHAMDWWLVVSLSSPDFSEAILGRSNTRFGHCAGCVDNSVLQIYQQGLIGQ